MIAYIVSLDMFTEELQDRLHLETVCKNELKL